MMTKKKEMQYVVYTMPVGRTPVGVYRRHVVVAGNVAIVLPRNRSGFSLGQHGDLLPAANVFGQDEKAAKAYLAGGEGGRRCWAVFVDQHPSKENAKACKLFEVFEAFAIYHTIENYNGYRQRERTLMRADNKAVIVGSEWSCRTFDSKSEALTFAKEMLTAAIQQATKDFDAAKIKLRQLKAINLTARSLKKIV